MQVKNVESLVGRRVRWTWTGGPTKGMTHEHFFAPDGSVTFENVGGPQQGERGHADKYAAERVTPTVHVVSYLTGAGYTLTVVMDFERRTLVGFASNDKHWHPVKGTFEMVD